MAEGTWEYVRKIKISFIAIILLFTLAFVAGNITAIQDPATAKIFMDQIDAKFTPIIDLNPFIIMIVIFLNNSLISLVSVLLGILFGIVPIIVTISNGYALGIVFYMLAKDKGILYLITGIVPHGIIELPIVFISLAIGLNIGFEFIRSIFCKKTSINLCSKHTDIKTELKEGIHFYFHKVLPLLLLAAIIETFITPLFIALN